ncbi:MAG: hypothetical protein DMD66_10615, partial [Gemmatimonadetes bacterium]
AFDPVAGNRAPTKTHPESTIPAPKTEIRYWPRESALPQAYIVSWTQDTPVGVAKADIAARDAAPPLFVVTRPHTTASFMGGGVQPQATAVQEATASGATIR